MENAVSNSTEQKLSSIQIRGDEALFPNIKQGSEDLKLDLQKLGPLLKWLIGHKIDYLNSGIDAVNKDKDNVKDVYSLAFCRYIAKDLCDAFNAIKNKNIFLILIDILWGNFAKKCEDFNRIVAGASSFKKGFPDGIPLKDFMQSTGALPNTGSQVGFKAYGNDDSAIFTIDPDGNIYLKSNTFNGRIDDPKIQPCEDGNFEFVMITGQGLRRNDDREKFSYKIRLADMLSWMPGNRVISGGFPHISMHSGLALGNLGTPYTKLSHYLSINDALPHSGNVKIFTGEYTEENDKKTINLQVDSDGMLKVQFETNGEWTEVDGANLYPMKKTERDGESEYLPDRAIIKVSRHNESSSSNKFFEVSIDLNELLDNSNKSFEDYF